MSDLLNRFRICSQISEELKLKVKIFHVFRDGKGFNVLFITSDDKVFAFGDNALGLCGLGHNSAVKVPQLIPQLCDKNIQQFFIGFDFILGLNSDKQLYGWGRNYCGQLGRGFKSDDYNPLKPEKIDFQKGSVIQVSCGLQHAMALTSEGNVYSWGNNSHGQVGCGEDKIYEISKPIRLEIFNNISIKSIHCSYNKSFALTSDGLVYSWGYTEWYDLGHELKRDGIIVFEPKLINLSGITHLCSHYENTYFITKSNELYFCGKYGEQNKRFPFQKTPRKLNPGYELDNLHLFMCHFYLKPCGFIGKLIYEIEHGEIKNTKYSTLFDYYCDEYKVCYKTLSISEDMPFDGNDVSDLFIHEEVNKFDKYQVVSEFGEGGYGEVFQVKNWKNIEYALKIIRIVNLEEKEFVLREVNVLYKCDNEYVVHCFDHWIEDNCLYIRMELCSHNLKNLIQQKRQCFERGRDEAMDIKEYFISCQLFQELLECVQYLHESNPPIIHRDIKPENILITHTPKNGRFLKLGDFGSAKFTTFTTHSTNTRGEGTFNYMSPEVFSGMKYNTKADVFSVGKVGKDIFYLYLSTTEKFNNSVLTKKWQNLEKIIDSMLRFNYKDRPTCAQISRTKHWQILKSEISSLHLGEIHTNIYDIGEDRHFFDNYLFERISTLKNQPDQNILNKLLGRLYL